MWNSKGGRPASSVNRILSRPTQLILLSALACASDVPMGGWDAVDLVLDDVSVIVARSEQTG